MAWLRILLLLIVLATDYACTKLPWIFQPDSYYDKNPPPNDCPHTNHIFIQGKPKDRDVGCCANLLERYRDKKKFYDGALCCSDVRPAECYTPYPMVKYGCASLSCKGTPAGALECPPLDPTFNRPGRYLKYHEDGHSCSTNGEKEDDGVCKTFGDEHICVGCNVRSLCSASQACCDKFCQYKPKSQQCLAATSCSAASMCSGIGAECPAPVSFDEGTRCSDSPGGKCNSGKCVADPCAQTSSPTYCDPKKECCDSSTCEFATAEVVCRIETPCVTKAQCTGASATCPDISYKIGCDPNGQLVPAVDLSSDDTKLTNDAKGMPADPATAGNGQNPQPPPPNIPSNNAGGDSGPGDTADIPLPPNTIIPTDNNDGIATGDQPPGNGGNGQGIVPDSDPRKPSIGKWKPPIDEKIWPCPDVDLDPCECASENTAAEDVGIIECTYCCKARPRSGLPLDVCQPIYLYNPYPDKVKGMSVGKIEHEFARRENSTCKKMGKCVFDSNKRLRCVTSRLITAEHILKHGLLQAVPDPKNGTDRLWRRVVELTTIAYHAGTDTEGSEYVDVETYFPVSQSNKVDILLYAQQLLPKLNFIWEVWKTLLANLRF